MHTIPSADQDNVFVDEQEKGGKGAMGCQKTGASENAGTARRTTHKSVQQNTAAMQSREMN